MLFMNSNIIPVGPTETVTDGTITQPMQVVAAETDLTISAIVYQFPVTGTTGAVSAFTLKAGRNLFNVKSITYVGTATLIYRKL